jgi:tRNA threonylcarbamoyladenosine biosynthesis protein TsaE
MRLDLEGMEDLAREVASGIRPGESVFLTGDLGAGKSVFARAFLRELGVTGAIPSPSFSVDAEYSLPGRVLHHIDLYRLSGDTAELEAFGILDILASDAVSVIEWSDRLPAGLARTGTGVSIAFTDDPLEREVEVERLHLAGD